MINLTDKYGYVVSEIERRGHQLFKMDGQWHCSDEQAVQVIIDTFDAVPLARADAVRRINSEAQTHMQTIEDEYPEFEKRTWPTQKAEVEAWFADNMALTPTLDTIAAARDIPREVLLQKTKEKVDAYNTLAATLAGTRQKIEDQILASTNMDFICNVKFEA